MTCEVTPATKEKARVPSTPIANGSIRCSNSGSPGRVRTIPSQPIVAEAVITLPQITPTATDSHHGLGMIAARSKVTTAIRVGVVSAIAPPAPSIGGNRGSGANTAIAVTIDTSSSNRQAQAGRLPCLVYAHTAALDASTASEASRVVPNKGSPGRVGVAKSRPRRQMKKTTDTPVNNLTR